MRTQNLEKRRRRGTDIFFGIGICISVVSGTAGAALFFLWERNTLLEFSLLLISLWTGVLIGVPAVGRKLAQSLGRGK